MVVVEPSAVSIPSASELAPAFAQSATAEPASAFAQSAATEPASAFDQSATTGRPPPETRASCSASAATELALALMKP